MAILVELTQSQLSPCYPTSLLFGHRHLYAAPAKGPHSLYPYSLFDYKLKLIKMQNEESESLSNWKYRALVTGIDDTASFEVIEMNIKRLLPSCEQMMFHSEDDGKLSVRCISSMTEEESSELQKTYNNFASEIGNISIKTTQIVDRKPKRMDAMEKRIVQEMKQKQKIDHKTVRNKTKAFLVSLAILGCIFYLGAGWLGMIVDESVLISSEEAPVVNLFEKPPKKQTVGSEKQANGQQSQSKPERKRYTYKSKAYQQSLQQNLRAQTPSKNENKQESQEKTVNDWKSFSKRQKYSREEEEMKARQVLESLPHITDYTESEGKVSFKINDKVYTANKKVKRAVNNIEETLVAGVPYLREAETEEYTLEPIIMMSNEEKKMLVFNQQSKKQIEEYLARAELKAKKFEFMMYRNILKAIDAEQQMRIEYTRMNQLYNLDKFRQEKLMCVVATGRNLFSSQKAGIFFKSISQQNYTNFKVVHIDDNSEDNTTLRSIADIYDQYPNLVGKVHLLRNTKTLGASSNKDSGIKENCPPDSIVLDVDADDGLVGWQVMNVLNAIYQGEESPWVVYSNFIIVKFNGRFQAGFSTPVQGPIDEYRRTSKNFHTSHLKTYLAGLQMKIPIDYLTEVDVINGKQVRKYPRYASDSSMMFSLLEMAGDFRTKYLPHMLYRYSLNRQFLNECHHAHQFYDFVKKKSLHPLAPLKSLVDSPSKMEKAYPQVELRIAKFQYYDACELEGAEKLEKPSGIDQPKSNEMVENTNSEENNT